MAEQSRGRHVSPEKSVRPTRSEWVVAITVATAIAVVVTIWSRNLWFFSDIWDFLAARDGSFESLMRQHGGHWTLWTAIAVRAVARIAQMQFFPLYVLPVVALYGAYSILVWRVLRWRGTSQVVSVAIVALIGFLGTSAWLQNVTYIALLLVHIAALGLAVLLAVKPPSTLLVAAASAMLLVAVSAEGTGVALLMAYAMTAAAFRRWRWLSAIAIPTVAYGWWWSTFGQLTPASLAPQISITTIVMTPKSAFDILVGGVSALTPITGIAASLVLILVLAFVIACWVREGIDIFDALLATTLTVVVGLIALVRVASGGFPPTASQYAFNVILFLVPILVPKIGVPVRLQNRGTSILIGFGIGALVLFNASTLRSGIDLRAGVQQAHLPRVNAAARIVDNGEPFLPFAGVSPQLSGASVERLNQRYPRWYSEVQSDQATIEARGRLRSAITQSGTISGTPLAVGAAADAEACVQYESQDDIRARIAGTGRVSLLLDDSGLLRIRWEDRFGVGTNEAQAKEGMSMLSYVSADSASIELVPIPATAMRVCGVTFDPGS